ncbi:carboxylesterase/lipase family protein [Chryseobacterium sp. S90]|uniref:carboxylesterase/lipase family protein n=1 Tax=Chryseobacterium sp. S90 TaxID=3395373 RepID=UPI0039BCDF05
MSISTVVSTVYGKIEGKIENGVSVWKGIPYARPPIGNLRFKAPKTVESWNDIKKTIDFSPIAPQISLEKIVGLVNEDCLYLNIWSPNADNAKRPVLFWIHGGAYLTGSGSISMYNGSALSKEGNIVVVTINYRLGPFGFLCATNLPGGELFDTNNGLRDQLAALKWVKENIRNFGGDSDNIMIFGESAGGASVINQMGSPKAKGLFQKAIAQSPCMYAFYSDSNTAIKSTVRLLETLGLKSSEILKLWNLPVKDLVDASVKIVDEIAEVKPGNIAFQPVLGDDVLPVAPYLAISKGIGSTVPLIVGSNQDEGTMFATLPVARIMPINDDLISRFLEQNYPSQIAKIKDAYKSIPIQARSVKMGGDSSIMRSVNKIAESMTAVNTVYTYRFRWTSNYLIQKGLSSFHSLEIPFVFKNLQSIEARAMLKKTDENEIENLSHTMSQAWINFAHTGNPNISGEIEWPAYDMDTRPCIVFDQKISIENDIEAEFRNAWSNS